MGFLVPVAPAGLTVLGGFGGAGSRKIAREKKMRLWRRFVTHRLSGFILAWENPEGCLCEGNKEGEH